MPVTVSKPAFNLREALNSLRRKMGVKGAELLRADTTDDVYASVKPVMFRNKFINGGFDVWQRGVSFGESPGYTADRWTSQSNPTGSTITQQAFTPGQIEVPGNPKYFYRLAIGSTTSSADRVVLRQQVENYHQFVGRWVVLSGWYRLTASLGGMNWLFQMKRSSSFYDNATEQADPRGALEPTSSWRYFERKIFVPRSALSGQSMTSTASFSVMLYYQSVLGTGNVDLANLQLELDSVTPFEQRPYATELALCQRYFTKTYNQNVYPGANSDAYEGSIRSTVQVTNSYTSFGNWRFPVAMRANPTVIAYNPRTGASNGFAADASDLVGVGITNSGESGVSFFTSGVSVGTHVFIQVAATASAEL